MFARWKAASAAVRETMPCELNISYGPTEDETLDLFLAAPGAPLAIYFHGGYWRALHKDDSSYVARGLVPLGCTVAVVNYALVPLVQLDAIVAQARRAVAFLRDNVARRSYDASRIVTVGHSAGGHLAAMAAVTTAVRGVATISGLHDLVPIQRSFTNDWLGLTLEEARALSPIAHPPAAAVRIFATAGERESKSFKAQGRTLLAAWQPYGAVGMYEDGLGDDHFTIAERLTDPGDPLCRKIVACLDPLSAG